ncbi:DNA replication/repair protein RecF [Novosphingobium sp. Gsoil 351]|uniref:DNA replication/repair protein RecF n=1 Tax=Novosphingobium sp. Gsoil 351 TaxID=2675225 RepID=UPI0012B45144|nr:DNA replication/repair protein RecF [Novosphingobium sp. Gsoil 351]QGN55445.1 DNA replication/repair protein RecF [Novosphingobium sp. Gsoil 351]
MLDRILLEDFRNHATTAIEGTARFNLLVGDNGAGKTNVLEALSLLAPGRGLRRAALGEMARGDGTGGFAVSARLGDDTALGTAMRSTQPGRRVVHGNGADIPAVRLGEWLSVAWLTPAMDRLFADSAGARRRFLDRLVLALEPGHAALAARYDAALRERNRLLAGEADPDPLWLDGIEAQLAESGEALVAARLRVVIALDQALTATPAQPFARPSLSYASETGADLAAALHTGRRRDRAAGRTLSGPHRDDLAVTLAAKRRAAADCSTGEQKAMLIAIVLAHAALLDPARPRVLLLDEVAAHLDPVRRAALFERLRAVPGQYWLTGTETAPFAEILGEAAVWEVREGAVSRV